MHTFLLKVLNQTTWRQSFTFLTSSRRIEVLLEEYTCERNILIILYLRQYFKSKEKISQIVSIRKKNLHGRDNFYNLILVIYYKILKKLSLYNQ